MLKSLIMKTLKNLFYMFVILAVGGFATSCTDDTTEPAGGIKGDGVYFPNTLGSVVYLTEGATSVDIPVMRTNTNGALTVDIQSFGTDEIFTVPSSVTFAADENTATLKLTYSASAVEKGVEYPLVLVVGDVDQETVYGNTTFSAKMLLDPWEHIGQSIYEDGVNLLNTYLVETYKKKGTDNEFRFYRPYEQAINSSEEKFDGTGDMDDYLEIYIDEDGLITYDDYMTGIKWEMGSAIQDIYLSHPSAIEGFDVTNNCVLRDGVFHLAPIMWNLESGYGQAYNEYSGGVITIVLPGYSNIDPKVAVEYAGVLLDPEGDSYAKIDVICNSDVAYYYISITDTPSNEFIAAMMNGTDRNVIIENGHTEVKTHDFLVDTPNTYYAVVIPVAEGEDGELYGDVQVAEFEYTLGTNTVAPADFDVTVTVENLDYFEGDLTITPNANNLRYYTSLMSKSDYAKCVQDAGSIDKYMLAYWQMLADVYDYTFAEVMEILNPVKKGKFETHIKEFDPATEYVVFAYCIDTKTFEARSPIRTFNFTTDPEPELAAKYSEWLGTWTVKSTSSLLNDAPQTFSITIQKYKANVNFMIHDWGWISSVEEMWNQELPSRAFYNEDGTLQLEEMEVGQHVNGYLYFFALVDYGGQTGVNLGGFGEGYPFLMGTVNGNSAELKPWTLTIDGYGLETVGADIFNVMDTAYLYTEEQDPPIGPFTLTKKAAPKSFNNSADDVIDAPFVARDRAKLEANPSVNAIRANYSLVIRK